MRCCGIRYVNVAIRIHADVARLIEQRFERFFLGDLHDKLPIGGKLMHHFVISIAYVDVIIRIKVDVDIFTETATA